jgi:hypothetical protein
VFYYVALFDIPPNLIVRVPAMLETHMFAFNQTTLKQLKLKLPPPYASCGTNDAEWTWSVVADYADKIKKAGYSEGFRFNAEWDEEVRTLLCCVNLIMPSLRRTKSFPCWLVS